MRNQIPHSGFTLSATPGHHSMFVPHAGKRTWRGRLGMACSTEVSTDSALIVPSVIP